MQVNFLSHFYLTNLIIQRQAAARRSTFSPDDQCGGQTSRSLRVINVSSNAYAVGSMARLDEMMTSAGERGRDAVAETDIYESYADTKLALMLFTTELNFRHSVDNVVCIAAHPGSIFYYYCFATIILANYKKAKSKSKARLYCSAL